jgi:predicted transcriptional regulator
MEVLLRVLRLGEDALIGYVPTTEGICVGFIENGERRQVVLRILSHDLPAPTTAAPVQPTFAADALFRARPAWHIDELNRRRLPKCWSREWLLDALFRHRGNHEAVAQEGETNVTAVRHFCEVHCIHNTVEEVIRSYAAEQPEGTTKKSIARALGLSESVVSKYLGSAQHTLRNSPEVMDLIRTCLSQRMSLACVRKEVRMQTSDRRSDERLNHLINRIKSESQRGPEEKS